MRKKAIPAAGNRAYCEQSRKRGCQGGQRRTVGLQFVDPTKEHEAQQREGDDNAAGSDEDCRLRDHTRLGLQRLGLGELLRMNLGRRRAVGRISVHLREGRRTHHGIRVVPLRFRVLGENKVHLGPAPEESGRREEGIQCEEASGAISHVAEDRLRRVDGRAYGDVEEDRACDQKEDHVDFDDFASQLEVVRDRGHPLRR